MLMPWLRSCAFRQSLRIGTCSTRHDCGLSGKRLLASQSRALSSAGCGDCGRWQLQRRDSHRSEWPIASFGMNLGFCDLSDRTTGVVLFENTALLVLVDSLAYSKSEHIANGNLNGGGCGGRTYTERYLLWLMKRSRKKYPCMLLQ